MPFLESILGRISGDILYKSAKSIFNVFNKPKYSQEQIGEWNNIVKSEVIFESDYLDELYTGVDAEKAKLRYINRSTNTQEVSFKVSLARIDGPLHGPLQSIYVGVNMNIPNIQLIAPNASVGINIQEAINNIKAKIEKPLDTSYALQNRFPKESIIPINDSISLSAREVLLPNPNKPYLGVGFTLRISVGLGNGFNMDRYVYGGQALIDSEDILKVAVNDKENSSFRYLNNIIPFCSAFIYDNIEGHEGGWIVVNNLKCIGKDVSNVFTDLSSKGQCHLTEIISTSGVTGLKNLGSVLMFIRKSGPVNFDGKI